MIYPSISIITPTYNESTNLPVLISRIESVIKDYGLDIELIVVDDNSNDGIEEVIDNLRKKWVHLYVRKENRSLSLSVCEGLSRAKNDMLVVMDADLSHPPEVIPQLLEVLMSGSDFVLGSRYVDGGSTSHDWGFLRWLNSRAATTLALPFTTVKDPMSGFFAIPKAVFQRANALNPIGYKIGLELIVKCACERIREVPIHFENRKFGESKLTLREQLKYVHHICRLLAHKYPFCADSARFFIVATLGLGIYLGLLAMLLQSRVSSEVAIAISIVVASVSHLSLSRYVQPSTVRNKFDTKRRLWLWQPYLVGAVVNCGVTIALLTLYPHMFPLNSATLGFLLGSIVQRILSQYRYFKFKYYRH